MRCVIQRSGPARVDIDGQTVGAIDGGLVVLAAFAPGGHREPNSPGWRANCPTCASSMTTRAR